MAPGGSVNRPAYLQLLRHRPREIVGQIRFCGPMDAVTRSDRTGRPRDPTAFRVDACDTCHYYIKTVDLTKNGRAVPVVDELAAIPLSLWAAENGYMKVSTNLLGL